MPARKIDYFYSPFQQPRHMRFLLTPEITGNQKVLPFNYQYPLSAWIYRTIHEGNHDFAEFLHNKGFSTGERVYKFFTFSQLLFPAQGFKVVNNNMQLLCKSIGLEISFLVPEAVQHFISGLFQNQQFSIGNKEHSVAFAVRSVEAKPVPVFSNRCSFSSLSPIMISRYDESRKHAEYLRPGHPDYEKIFFDNLVRKYAVARGAGLLHDSVPTMEAPAEMKFRFSEPVKQKGVLIKAGTSQQTQIIGYMYNFEIEAPPELIKIGYLAGFGEKNSLGMGCAEPVSLNLTI